MQCSLRMQLWGGSLGRIAEGKKKQCADRRVVPPAGVGAPASDDVG